LLIVMFHVEHYSSFLSFLEYRSYSYGISKAQPLWYQIVIPLIVVYDTDLYL
jgi:hypothetical protein